MTPTEAMTAAHEAGAKTGERFPSLRAFWDAVEWGDAEAPGYLSEPTSVLALCWESGFCGEPLPRWVRAVRIGRLPECGRSRNHRDDCLEHGVSVLCVEGGARTDNGTFDLFNAGPRITVEGWLHFRTGSDGEPLLVGAREVVS